MKKFSLIFIAITVILSCNKSEKTTPLKAVKAKVNNSDFGFNFAHYNVLQDTVKPGDTFGSIIEKQNIGKKSVYEIVQSIKDTFDVKSIKPNRAFTVLRTKDKTNKIQLFIYKPDALSYYIFDFRDSLVVATKKTRPITIRKKMIGGVLKGSLSETLDEAGVDTGLASKMTKIYSWTIDFFKLKKGDRFGLIFTERYINDSIYDGVENLEAAFFEYKGNIKYAFPYCKNPANGKIDYYDDEGKTLKNFFLKSPIKFSRISSRFSRNRFHPVQGRWKAHKGTDYAAPTGTPITTTASGIVEKTGYTSGNGNFVKVKHNSVYATQYLHMSKILVRRGQRVTQGAIIGRVGSTGLATGPHVCYRFWKNGVQVDALGLNLPTGEAMTGSDKIKFLEQTKPLRIALDSLGNL
ncbi:MAG: hypothetical protein QG594_2440 [Bacteroidota bacterium]|nr:hypothetical protein [Bacteroidota bacterium]